MNKGNFTRWIHISCFLFLLVLSGGKLMAKEISETTFLIADLKPHILGNERFWNYLQSNNHSGLEIHLTEQDKAINLTGSTYTIDLFIERLHQLLAADSSKIIPVFIHYRGNVSVLDSIISQSEIASNLFFLPRGEAWPPIDYLIQSNRRILFFISDNIQPQGRMFHPTNNYVLNVSAIDNTLHPIKPNLELLLINDFEKLPISTPSGSNIRNLVPDYINFLLETWTRFGKRPNFLFVNDEILNLDFIISQLNSFTWFNGTVKGSGKTFEKVYWKNPEVLVTGGHFSFPYRGGEELTLTPFVPGYRMTPEQIVVTGEMEVPENYNIMAFPLNLSDGLTGNFPLDQSVQNLLEPIQEYSGEKFSFIQDIEREMVLRLPEGASINLKSPEKYGLRNSSFTVSCFVKFNEIMEFGDNAILGNYESEYRRGLHLILRSGNPYFGLWANDYLSEEKLEPNTWYHMVWRYIIETGEQAIFLNGKNIGSSTGHPPFMGTGDIHLGSALSQGASLRGYIDELNFWNRPLGAEEITRLSLNEPVQLNAPITQTNAGEKISLTLILGLVVLFFLGGFAMYFLVRKKGGSEKRLVILPNKNTANMITLFGSFRITDREGNDISGLFTPKIKELLLFTLLTTLRNGTGASIADIDQQLWPDMQAKKVSNNRAVTLNKLRKLLKMVDGLEIITENGFLVARLDKPFFCDYVEAYNLCHLAGGMSKQQLEMFYILVKKGQFLKGINWQWLDEVRGNAGNQVIDNLLKLALIYKNDKRFSDIEDIAHRILDYDDLNEEATWLIVWCLRQRNNGHQARFYFDSFSGRYLEAMAEKYPMNYETFKSSFTHLLQEAYAAENNSL